MSLAVKMRKKIILEEGVWSTAMGAWVPGSNVIFRGKDFFSELNTASWMGVILYAIDRKSVV